MTYGLEVSGLFEHRLEGEQAAQTLREKGYRDVSILPVNNQTLSLCHIANYEARHKRLLTLVALPTGFLIGALCTTPLALIFGWIFDAPIAFVCGIIGAVLAVFYVRKPIAHSDEAVIVTACCPLDARKPIVKTLHDAKADELDLERLSEADTRPVECV